MAKELRSKVEKAFRERFSDTPLLVRAPGRINLIGEHTDYNQGFVFPAAVGQETSFAIGRSNSEKCTLYALDLEEEYSFNLSEIRPLRPNSWQNYILGVVSEITKTGRTLEGFSLVLSGNVPKGAGMSSSAALECGTCFALNELFQLEIPKLEMVHLAQKAEHNYAGVKCGIMDQFASVMGKEGNAFMLDCRNLSHDYFPLELRDHSFLLIDSNVSHNLANSEYNVRRLQCEEGVEALKVQFPEIQSLRDADMQQLSHLGLDPAGLIYKRCKYVIEENIRVKDFANALNARNVEKAGDLLNAAHLGMRHEYEITCPEIDFMIDHASSRAEVLGARMMGGGFGGCTLNLIEKGAEMELVSSLRSAYYDAFEKEATPIPIHISSGVSMV